MTESDNNAAATAESAGHTPPGRQLREAREARGLTIQETAAKLHLHQHMLYALEADDYDQLPSPIYVRGYLRNYSRLLGLDADEIVAAYDGSENEHPELKPPLQAPSQVTSADKPVKAVTYLLTLVLVLLLLAWWQSRNVSYDRFMETESPASMAQTKDETAADKSSRENIEEAIPSNLGYPIRTIRHPETTFFPLPADPADPAEQKAVDGEAELPRDTATTPAELLENLPALDAGDAAADPGAETGPTDTATASTPAAEASREDVTEATPPVEDSGLRLDLSEESWIEVYDAEGQRLYLGLGQPGETIQVDGTRPLRVLLGYAPGVEVRFDGEPVDTIEHSRSGVAQFRVGD